jgi:ABC-type bacteriocin/lantibiotic exporter with double-glycine peptidase domain
LIQAISVITVALVIGCIFSWALTLVTASGLVAIVVWYQIITPLVVKRYADVQKVETEAAGAAFEALSGIKMIAACGAEDKIMQSYSKLVERMNLMGRRLSPMLAVQHSPGM